MECPYCNEEMKKGTLPNETHPYWLPEGKKAPFFRLVVPKAGVRLVVEDSAVWQKATAFYCPKCKIVIARTEE